MKVTLAACDAAMLSTVPVGSAQPWTSAMVAGRADGVPAVGGGVTGDGVGRGDEALVEGDADGLVDQVGLVIAAGDVGEVVRPAPEAGGELGTTDGVTVTEGEEIGAAAPAPDPLEGQNQ
ncbi:hypothetical protein Back2_10660 [Nocardioides baekrokdamisoli]|uniref:Uncharacterized protein n=2 Tax=Nocardioides baekrokdamisoli TaxID=1804624 RepID=A0A3G9J1D7_9ACTN|nr:hypothetical protein Back2_10660 [Nocardioides baekrokdamisoli]